MNTYNFVLHSICSLSINSTGDISAIFTLYLLTVRDEFALLMDKFHSIQLPFKTSKILALTLIFYLVDLIHRSKLFHFCFILIFEGKLSHLSWFSLFSIIKVGFNIMWISSWNTQNVSIIKLFWGASQPSKRATFSSSLGENF